MMHVYPGLTVDTPHGLGVVMAVRDDGMVVTKLVSSGGGAGFTGYFHPSTVGHSSSSSSVGGVVGTVGVARDTASNAFLPTRAAAAAPCMFQPVSSMEHGGFQVTTVVVIRQLYSAIGPASTHTCPPDHCLDNRQRYRGVEPKYELDALEAIHPLA